MKTFYFKDCNSLDQVKARYKELAMKWHPDRGGDKGGIPYYYEKFIPFNVDAHYNLLCWI